MRKLLDTFNCIHISNEKRFASNRVDTLRVHHYDLYVRPWFHVSPYFIGVFFGWLMSQLKDRKFTFNQYLANVMWLLALVSLFLCSFAAYKKFYEPQYYEDFAMPVGMTIIKPYFMVCIAFVILLCFLGNGGLYKMNFLRFFLFLIYDLR